MTSIDTSGGGWWHDLVGASLLGTARRAAPTVAGLGIPGLGTPGLVGPDGSRADEVLLTSAAVGAVARQAGLRPGRLEPGPASPDDGRPEAPVLAVQLLALVLHQPPVEAGQQVPLLLHWLRCADRAGRRVPHALLPELLDRATATRELRHPVALVVDERGLWLAEQNPAWAWVPEAIAAASPGTHAAAGNPNDTHPANLTPDDWARLPSAARVAVLADLRTRESDVEETATSPAATARALIASTWTTDSAKDRKAHLETLRIGLDPADEDLLERALDDRAASVREVAWTLLDALPGSARAARMAERLRPLLTTTGLVRRRLDVALPDEPDAAGVRDGLGKPPARRSARGWWLERIVAGAPLDVWTEVTGADPATVVGRLASDDALLGIRAAARARRDATWAAAVLESDWAPELVPLLPRADRERAVLTRLASNNSTGDTSAVGLLGALPAPWSREFSLELLHRLRTRTSAATAVTQAMPALLDGLHPDSLGALEEWVERLRPSTLRPDKAGADATLQTRLRTLLQYHSVTRSITEAFR